MHGILRLLDLPFGPYPEDDILSEKFPKGKVLKLSSFYMECGGSPIGFDETEFITTPPQTSRIARAPTEFYGVLEIESLDWLSPRGRDWLQLDLRQRDIDSHPQLNTSGLTLSRLHGHTKGEGSRIRVRIQGVKNMSAQFMSEDHPLSLIIYSLNKCGRIYNITSLDVGTFEGSQNFLTRYRLWALIEEIIRTDPVGTSLRNRTIDWLVDEYRRRLRRRDQRRRLFEIPADLGTVTSKRRFLRHLPRAEVISIFAAHADWLLAQQLAPSTNNLKRVNIVKWLSFCKQIAAARRNTSKYPISWGLPYGGTSHEQSLDLSRFGETSQFWENRIKNTMKKSKKKLKPMARRRASPVNSHVAVVAKRRQPELIYDSDFSEASTSACSDSSNSDRDKPRQLDVPSFCIQPPTIPAGRFTWRCPGCDYLIDFLDLSGENTEKLSLAVAQALLNKSWSTLREEWVQTAFFQMVHVHYATHRPQHSAPYSS